MKIKCDRIAYLVPKKNLEAINDYFIALIEQTVIDLKKVKKQITDLKKI